ncbi:MAG: hypothetical protein ACLP9L_42170 [Thermoguttaceae bacterium]
MRTVKRIPLCLWLLAALAIIRHAIAAAAAAEKPILTGKDAASEKVIPKPDEKLPEKSIYDAFDAFCRAQFGAAKEELTYTAFEKDLRFDETGAWAYASVESACIGFETVLPARSSVEYGTTASYGQRTKATDRFCYLHLHYLQGLQPGRRYHYRLLAIDERGNRIASPDRILETKSDRGMIRIPGGVAGPPYILDRPGGVYLVTRDMVIDSRAFQITAKDITLDLGGHTVVYDNTHMGPPGSPPYFPVFVAKSAFGVLVQGANFRIFNGMIRQGAGKDASQANAIGFNPIYIGAQPGEIAGVTLDYSGDQMTGIQTHWMERCDIHHNVVCDRGTVIIDRHQGCDGIGMLRRPAQGKVHHNLLLRVRHRGVGGKEVYHNEIYGDSYNTNSFGISVVSSGKYYGNRIFGTGYHFVGIQWATGIEVFNNFIQIQGEKPTSRSDEYGPISSENGVRLTQYGGTNVPYENVSYHENVIVLKGREGSQLRGTEFFSDPFVKNLIFRNNVVKVLGEDLQTLKAACVVTQGSAFSKVDADTMLPIRYENNVFLSNLCNVRFGDSYGVGSNHQFIRCKFVRLGDDPRYKTFIFDYPHLPCKRHIALDCTFEGGASLDSVGWADKTADVDFTVQWTLDIKTVPGAVVTVKDKSGAEAFRGKADGSGLVSVALSQYVQRPAGKTLLTPHSITAIQDGKTASATVIVDKRQSIQLPVK